MDRVLQRETLSDQELVSRCQAGDEGAFDELVRRHQQRALNVAWQLLRNYEDATEVAQDAFVRVYRNIGSFRGESAFTTWLHQIVVNLARNRHRWWKRRGKQTTVSLDEPLETTHGELARQVEAHTDGPDVTAVKQEFVQQIKRAMERLPRTFREVLVLRNVEEMSYEQIAAVLGLSIGTVKSRIARARAALRDQVQREG
jgi:RNA polymerase sigma-70 factor (ECF subfamily)